MSADTPEATRAGLEILARGGNAVDAGVAVSLALGVTEPSESGLGGSVLMLLVPAGASGTWIGAPPPLPADSLTQASPDALRVLYYAWRHHGSGRMTWEELVRPAIRIAEGGFATGTFSHHTMVLAYDRVVDDPAMVRRLLAPDRSIPAEGTLVSNPELAAVLEQIATGGPDAFYAGDVARRIAHELTGDTGAAPVTTATLAATPAVREAHARKGSYRGRIVWTVPDPIGGGVQQALDFLELVPSGWLERDASTRLAWILEALAYSASAGEEHPVQRLAGLPPMPLPSAESITLDSAATLDTATLTQREVVPADTREPGAAAYHPAQTAHDEPLRDGSDAGTHFSVVDGAGNAVAVSQTLGSSYGSGLLESLGFFYQAAGGSRRSLPVPAIVTRDGSVELILGSPGGNRGMSAVVQVLSRIVDLGEAPADAVAAPRLQLARPGESDRGRVFFEGLIRRDSAAMQRVTDMDWGAEPDALARTRGFAAGEQPSGPWAPEADPWFGSVNLIARSGERWTAVGDDRRGAFGGVLTQGAPSLRPTDGSIKDPPGAPGG